MSISHRTEARRAAADRPRSRLAAAASSPSAAGPARPALLAACGSSDDDDELDQQHAASTGDGRHGLAVRRGRPRDRQLRADARVPRDRVLQRRREERPVQGRRPGADQAHRRDRAAARRRAHRDGQEARRPGAEARRRSSRSRTRPRCWSSRRRSRTSAPPRTSARRRTSSRPRSSRRRSSIHSVEGRHAAALNVLGRQEPTPDGAFAKPADMQEVLDAVQPFLV